jgi:hypothetical protein
MDAECSSCVTHSRTRLCHKNGDQFIERRSVVYECSGLAFSFPFHKRRVIKHAECFSALWVDRILATFQDSLPMILGRENSIMCPRLTSRLSTVIQDRAAKSIALPTRSFVSWHGLYCCIVTSIHLYNVWSSPVVHSLAKSCCARGVRTRTR